MWSSCLCCVRRTGRSVRELVSPSSWFTEVGLYHSSACKISRVMLNCPSAFCKSFQTSKMRQAKVLLLRAILGDIFHPSHLELKTFHFARLFQFPFPPPPLYGQQ